MENTNNRKTLYTYSLILVMLTSLSIFSFFCNFISGYIDGTYANMFAEVDADIVGIVKAVLIFILALGVLLIASQILIGIKGIKISKNPTADKGYITFAKVFFVLNIIASVISVVNLFQLPSEKLIDNILTTVSVISDGVIYAYFIKAAKDVRQSVIEGK